MRDFAFHRLEDGPPPSRTVEVAHVEYPFPLRGGTVIARLRLPLDFGPADVEPIYKFLHAIAGARPKGEADG